MDLVRLFSLLFFVTTVHGFYQHDLCHNIRIDRTQPGCSGTGTIDDEYLCIRQQASLKDLMDCVQPGIRTDESLTCTDPNNDDLYDHLEDNRIANEVCVTPRNIIISGSLDADCQICSVAGALEVCPMEDPNFHNCLCDNNVSPEAFVCLADCFFHRDVVEDMSCARVRRRGSVPSSPPNGVPDSPMFTDGGYQFYINQFGVPVYPGNPGDKDVYGIPLPWFDELLFDGTEQQRCYIYPFSNQLWCRRWVLKTAATQPLRTSTLPWNYGTAGGDANPKTRLAATKTYAPLTTKVTSIPIKPKYTPTAAETSRGLAAQDTSLTGVKTGKNTLAPTETNVKGAANPKATGKSGGSKSGASAVAAQLGAVIAIQGFLLI